jgi:NAD(P)-dependent dehydrogenase (short-subunit alcohol dehydrogenase family)
VLVTGVSAGLGVETLRTLAAHGASVVGTARDLAKARRAFAGVFPQAAKGAAIDLIELDLASLKSVRKAANELLAQARPFDVIIANGGVMGGCLTSSMGSPRNSAIARRNGRVSLKKKRWVSPSNGTNRAPGITGCFTPRFERHHPIVAVMND